MLFPLPFLHQEAPSPTDPVSWIENTYASSKTDFPLKKWSSIINEWIYPYKLYALMSMFFVIVLFPLPYSIDGPSERSLMLREIAMLASEQELLDFAEQVSMYSGCFHHRHQIVMSKKLLEDGTKTWNLVSEKNKQVLWENLAPEIEEQFKKISLNVRIYYHVYLVTTKIFLVEPVTKRIHVSSFNQLDQPLWAQFLQLS
ncbi:hypothetical protein DCAR_0417209 [Daucus carota subsp. sativus]|uniref:Uncharacterized protein n=1 Tax=Daucus carota subsp. sativus TaxID=79200 RepID=A0AAF0WZY5_DAUCS|nr:hypothetical protein DCAR_0417209 [Daucus carota subsp. sativus]